jgi:hypothetical protein
MICRTSRTSFLGQPSKSPNPASTLIQVTRYDGDMGLEFKPVTFQIRGAPDAIPFSSALV